MLEMLTLEEEWIRIMTIRDHDMVLSNETESCPYRLIAVIWLGLTKREPPSPFEIGIVSPFDITSNIASK